ncbi:MFS transporter, FHS family, L-fucose permease [Sphingomonas carotinifaciens]|uniref:MFS transporter, FHS family, L-fucose permease n=3 Tax=Sphingomonas carotinifaciens TaxID=1166323 RepID=A0A1G7P8Y3_9SPHN|nr:L-fucose:H+ symporter permease [Sphingomonas carotinifaciens]MBB4087354.1 FHS family L-fucose permease-like MFS transporter [Sphingomonas carotinifaciens]SDF82765.1 MFS transporter, FHS family, L-fucose permease [Sphingomonas carotinifaciens]
MAMPVMTAAGTPQAGATPYRGQRYLPALIITVSLFFLWGVANNLNDILIAQFRKAFTLSDFGTSFVQQVFYFGYFLLAVPASMVMRRFGYKAAIVTGLMLYAAGALLFYPAAQASLYQLFLLALFVIAAGLAFLETSANPLMTELGDPATAARRLNWAQAANPLGAITGILIGRFFILSGIEHDEQALVTMDAAAREAFYRSEVQAVVGPYMWIAAIVLAFAVAALFVAFPKNPPRDAGDTTQGGRFADVLRHPRLIGAVAAQFFYVGAQVGLWSYTIRYAQANAGFGERAGADALFVSLVLFAAGRFAGAALMARMAPVRLLALFAGISLALAAVAGLIGGTIGLYALVASSFFMSIQFPTIFAIGIDGLGPLRRIGASLIVMAIIGGAGLTALMGLVSDLAGITHAVLVSAASFAVVLAFAIIVGRGSARAG